MDILYQHRRLNILKQQLSKLQLELFSPSYQDNMSDEMWVFRHNLKMQQMEELLNEILDGIEYIEDKKDVG